MSRELILVTGAAGKTGVAVSRALVRSGQAVRAWVYRREHRSCLEAIGVSEIVEGDFRDQRALRTAVAGSSAIYHICPNMNPLEVPIGQSILEAAQSLGVRRFVFHSVLDPHVEAMPHHWHKGRVEELLMETDLEVTILRPAAYMQNFLGQWTEVVQQGVLEVPYAVSSRIALVDLEDVAEAASRVLSESGHRGSIYELCGEAGPDQREIAGVFSECLQRPVRAQKISRSVWARQAKEIGLNGQRLEAFLRMFRYYEERGMRGNLEDLQALLGRPPRTFRDFVTTRLTMGSSISS
ncbi:MAG: NmrA family NAD(P)-binding protein [Deltaproteobacteria bacterium]|nr:NmrA family NAD(P)-binding protein [Deltaproteobacteria bacterium]